MLTNELRSLYSRLLVLSNAVTLTKEQRTLVLTAGFLVESAVEHVLPSTLEELKTLGANTIHSAMAMVSTDTD